MAMPRRPAGQSAPAQGRWVMTKFMTLKASWQSMCDEMRRFPRFCISVLITGNASPDGGVGREWADDSQGTERPDKGKEYIANPNMTVIVQEASKDVRLVVERSVKSGCYPGGNRRPSGKQLPMRVVFGSSPG
jgi:hypothetical protein